MNDPEQISVVSRIRSAPHYVKMVAMGIESLTHRESEIADYLAAGFTNSQIADALCIGERTVETHIAAIFSKLGAVNRTHAAADAVRADTRIASWAPVLLWLALVGGLAFDATLAALAAYVWRLNWAAGKER